jgi:hypothetical protein
MADRREDKSIASGVDVRAVLWTGLTVFGVVAGIVAAVFAVRVFFRVEPPRAPPALVTPAVPPAPPRLQTDPRAERRSFEAEKRAILDSYGWVDRKAGVARIPIQRAIERLTGQEARP